jgi:hypothetical protein
LFFTLILRGKSTPVHVSYKKYMKLNIYKLILYFINLLIKCKIKINKSYWGFKLTYQVTSNKSSMIDLCVGFFLINYECPN